MRILRFIFIGFIFCLVFLLPSKAFAFSGVGNGTSGDPYQVTTCSQFQEIDNDLSADYKFMNDVDCSGFSFTPIGDSFSDEFFTGTLDGDGHKVTNLVISADTYDVGIFQSIHAGGVITRFGYESGSVTGGPDTFVLGGFAAEINGGAIIQSYSKADVDGSASNWAPPVGGFVGISNNSTISNSYYSGVVTGFDSYAGGMAGHFQGGGISNSYTAGSLVGLGFSVSGGFIGDINTGSVSNVFTTMSISSYTASGIIGAKSGSEPITNSFWYKTAGSPDHCYEGGDTGCTSESTLSYFYDITNAPMTSWDFNTIWSRVNNGTGYPVDYWQSPNLTSGGGSSSGSPSTPTCSTTPNGAPNLFQINTTQNSAMLFFSPVGQTSNYLVSYGFDSNANQFNVFTNQGSSTGVLSFTINSLPSNSTVYFKVFAQNNCGVGAWSNIMQARTNGGAYYKNIISQILSVLPQQTTVLGAKTVSKLNLPVQKINNIPITKPVIKKIPVVKPKTKVLGATAKKSCVLFICL